MSNVVERVKEYAGQEFSRCRLSNPNITKRETIELADYIAAIESNGIKPQLCDVLAQIADKEFILDDDRCVRVAYLEKIFSKYFT